MGKELGSAFTGGFLSAFFTAPVELIMIQQQRNGGTIFHALKHVASNHGFLQHGFFRGIIPTVCRDSLYVASMLGVTPILQTYLQDDLKLSPMTAGFYASLVGGVIAAIPTHPFDIVKTCMQGKGFMRRRGGATFE